MIRSLKRPSTAACTLPQYISFLLSEPRFLSCSKMGEVLNMSHDSVNRFLYREHYTPLDLFNEAKQSLELTGGVLSVDDSVLDKPYAQYMDYVGYFWSGKHHTTVKGINLVTMYDTDPKGSHLPVNFRVYDKSENKTKNDYFLDMLEELISWGVRPAAVTGDSWYSSVNNLKTVRHHGPGLLFAVESNRLVSEIKGAWTQVQHLDIPEEGRVVWLKDVGEVKVFRTHLRNQKRHYIVHLPSSADSGASLDKLGQFNRDDFIQWHDKHWKIEQYHRGIKQVCHIEQFQVRGKVAIKNHLFAAIYGFVQLQKLSAIHVLKNCYDIQRTLFNDVIRAFVGELAPTMSHLLPKFKPSINA